MLASRISAGMLCLLGIPLLLPAVNDPNRFAGTTRVTQVGGDLEIHFTNKNLANSTVSIIAADNDGHEVVVKIKLDANGKGKQVFHVPDWPMVVLEHPTSSDHGIVVL